jgi:hypothetical protein
VPVAGCVSEQNPSAAICSSKPRWVRTNVDEAATSATLRETEKVVNRMVVVLS